MYSIHVYVSYVNIPFGLFVQQLNTASLVMCTFTQTSLGFNCRNSSCITITPFSCSIHTLEELSRLQRSPRSF